MPVRIEGRVSKLRAELEAHGLDGLIVTHLPNIRYLTGFTGSAGVLLVFHDGVVLLTDFRYEVQASSEISQEQDAAPQTQAEEAGAEESDQEFSEWLKGLKS